MFQAVLHPLHRRPRLARGEAQRDHVGKHRLFHSEAAAGIARDAQAQLRGRHLERQRHDRVQGERAHEVRQDVVALVAGEMLSDYHGALDRRAGVARVAHVETNAVRRGRKRGIGIAVCEAAIAHDVRADSFVQDRRVRRDRRFDLDHGMKRFVVDLDQL